MKKLLTIGLVFAMALSIGMAFAEDSVTTTPASTSTPTAQTPMYGHRGMRGAHHGMMWQGKQGNMMRGARDQQNCPCLGNANGTTAQLITEDKAKEAAQTYIDKYLSGYTIEKVEKDAWRPMYIVSIKGANDAQQQMMIQGFSGQVMHVFPVTE